jgi:hypothetical protein
MVAVDLNPAAGEGSNLAGCRQGGRPAAAEGRWQHGSRQLSGQLAASPDGTGRVEPLNRAAWAHQNDASYPKDEVAKAYTAQIAYMVARSDLATA